MTKENILIYGAGFAGRVILGEIKSHEKNADVVGFIDDDISLKNQSIENIPVLGDRSIIIKLIEQKNIKRIIIALPSRVNNIINETTHSILKKYPEIKIQILPSIIKYFNHHLLADLENISLNDILKREEITLNIEKISSLFSKSVVLITGAGGSIGSELAKQLMRFDIKQLICIGRGEDSIYKLAIQMKEFESECEIFYRIVNVKDYQMFNNIVKQFKPDYIFHAAAHKHVPMMEINPQEAANNNILGTYNVLKSSVENQIKKFIFVSTDKAVNPKNVMGATKRVGELLTLEFSKQYNLNVSIVRFGNVIGSRGSVIPHFLNQIKKGGPLTVTHKDIERYFMTIPEAVLLILNSVIFNDEKKIFVLDMGRPYKIIDLAEKLISNFGLEPYKDIEIVFTGLRPGEKLFEELNYDVETLSKTENKSIFTIENNIDEKINIENVISNCCDIYNYKNEDVVKFLQSIVKTYDPDKSGIKENRIVE